MDASKIASNLIGDTAKIGGEIQPEIGYQTLQNWR